MEVPLFCAPMTSISEVPVLLNSPWNNCPYCGLFDQTANGTLALENPKTKNSTACSAPESGSCQREPVTSVIEVMKTEAAGIENATDTAGVVGAPAVFSATKSAYHPACTANVCTMSVDSEYGITPLPPATAISAAEIEPSGIDTPEGDRW